MDDTHRGPAIYVSADMEGCAAPVHWDEVMPGPSPEYERARRILAGEVTAALEGAYAAGARGGMVNDAHSRMRNLVLEGLEPHARLVSGRVKPDYMLEGIKAQSGALAFFVGYHGAIGDRDAVMGHTYSPRVIFECRLAGTVVGELTINAALAGAYGVAVALVSGDATTVDEAARAIPWAVRVETKRSLSYYAADSVSPAHACDALRAAAGAAVRRRAEMRCFTLPTPITLEIDTRTAAQADAACGFAGISRLGARTVGVRAADMAQAYRALIAIIHLGAAA